MGHSVEPRSGRRRTAPHHGAGKSVPIAALVLLTGGCAWRTGQTEHYIGPVLFRYVEPPSGKARVSQVERLGIAGEMGRQWGLTLGLSGRTAVAPRPADAAPATEPWRWSTPLCLLPPPEVGRWNLSLVYLREEGVPEPFFERRVVVGASALAGAEANAVSLGVTVRTQMDPPADAVSALRFDACSPMAAELAVWRANPGEELPVSDILKEVEP